MIGRLKEDHENARALAEGLAEIEGINIDMKKVETNMIILDTKPLKVEAEKFAHELSKHNVKVSIYGLHTIRFVTNKDVTGDDMILAVEAVESIVAGLI